MSIKRNTLWNIAGMGLPLIAAALFIPRTLHGLGNEAFGIVSLIWTLIGYFGLFDLGIGRALTVIVGRQTAEAKTDEFQHTLWAGMLITAITGLLGGVVMWMIAAPLAHDWLKVDEQLQADARQAFIIVAFGVLPTTMTSTMRGALEGQGRFSASNLVRLVFGVLMFALPAMSFELHGASLALIALYLVIARYIFFLITIALLVENFCRLPMWDRVKIQCSSLFSFGFWLAITGLVGPLMVYGDRFFVGMAVGPEQLPYYAIPQEGLLRLLVIPAAICGALLPMYAGMVSSELRVSYFKYQWRIAVLMFLICGVAAALATPILSFWISSEFSQKSSVVVLWMLAGVLVNSIAHMPYTILHAHGKSRITALFHLVEMPIYFALLYWLAISYGLPGVAAAWFLRTLLDYVLLSFAAIRLLNELRL